MIARRVLCRPVRRRGYVLLVTLVLLALAALAAAAVCRASLARAQAADEAQSDLQRRWGTLTCRTFLLPKTEEILHNREREHKSPLVHCRQTLMLGNEQFDLIFTDESAKANVGILMDRQPSGQAALTVRRLSLSNPDIAGKVRLRQEEGQYPQSFGEVFDSIQPAELLKGDGDTCPAEIVTCWGDGQLNIHRAGQDVLEEVCGKVLNLSQIEQLLDIRQSHPSLNMTDTLNQLNLDQAHRAMADTALIDESNCHGLWIICRAQRRSDWSFVVLDENKIMGGVMRCYEW